ncbi:ZIP family metal transporter [Haladaptatus pallidirubidus]|uniref:ZIP family metal transporter n=1 Tax=Haladaptatus pallidirubidus TaxID=1008152 RepID=UPI0035E7E129
MGSRWRHHHRGAQHARRTARSRLAKPVGTLLGFRAGIRRGRHAFSQFHESHSPRYRGRWRVSRHRRLCFRRPRFRPGRPVGAPRPRCYHGGRSRKRHCDPRTASVLLFIVAITLHNMPEGLAVGVGFGAGNLGDALALTLAIGIQNVPEGLAVAVAARNAGFGSLFYAAIAGVRAGLVEIPLAVFGALAVQVAMPILPYAMGFAAGGMLFVISDEIVPETHARGNEREATLGMMLGIVVMLFLDVSLG